MLSKNWPKTSSVVKMCRINWFERCAVGGCPLFSHKNQCVSKRKKNGLNDAAERIKWFTISPREMPAYRAQTPNGCRSLLWALASDAIKFAVKIHKNYMQTVTDVDSQINEQKINAIFCRRMDIFSDAQLLSAILWIRWCEWPLVDEQYWILFHRRWRTTIN